MMISYQVSKSQAETDIKEKNQLINNNGLMMISDQVSKSQAETDIKEKKQFINKHKSRMRF